MTRPSFLPARSTILRLTLVGLLCISGTHPVHATETITVMVNRLCQANGIAPGTVRSARVVSSNTLNAYTDGYKIVVYSALWHKMATDDARAFVVSHELSHILLNHRRNTVARKVGTRVINQAVGLTLGPAASLGSYAGMKLANLKFSRQQEYGADEKGLELMWRAGYDPQGAAAFFKAMHPAGTTDAREEPEFLQTHPLDQRRLAQLSARFSQLGPAPDRPGSGLTSEADATLSLSPAPTATGVLPASGSWRSDYQPAAPDSPASNPANPSPAPAAIQPPDPPPDFYKTDPAPADPASPLPSSPPPANPLPAVHPVVLPPAHPLPPAVTPSAKTPFQRWWGSSRGKPNRYGMTPVVPPPPIVPVSPPPDSGTPEADPASNTPHDEY